MEKSANDRPLPFTEADLVGPADRPRPDWEISMVEWQTYVNSTVKGRLDAMDGTAIKAIQCAAKPKDGLIYVTACDPSAPKAHVVTPIGNHRTATFSLFTPLLPFGFPRIGEKYRVVFKCWPEDYGKVKVLVIQVKGYRVERLEKESKKAPAANKENPMAELVAGPEQTKTPVTNVEKPKSTESVSGTERPKAETAAAAEKARSDSAVSQQVPDAESPQDEPAPTNSPKDRNRPE